MRYSNIQRGTFLRRPNRFIAYVELEGQMEVAHVKNTGRCRELLVPGAPVWLVAPDNPARKTRYDLVAVEKGSLLINMDSQAPNRVFEEYVRSGNFLPALTVIRPEYAYGASRLDFYLEQNDRRHLVEIKGVTLEENGVALFPDAPSERAIKHLRELGAAAQAGYECWLCFVVQMEGMRFVVPNERTAPEFGRALRAAAQAGVHVIGRACRVTPDTLDIYRSIPVQLE